MIRRCLSSLGTVSNIGKGRRVVVGFSGGVDSALTAFSLKRAGFDVLGVYMRNWEEKEEGFCNADQEEKEARQLADHLGIQFEHVNFVKEYWIKVFEDFLQGHADGLSPNPDVFCNREIKFHDFLTHAKTVHKADFVATGHYSRIERGPLSIQTTQLLLNQPINLASWAQQSATASPPLPSSESPDEHLRPLSDDFLSRLHISFDETDTSESASPRLYRGADPVKDQSYFLSMLKPGALDRVLFPLGSVRKAEVRAWARDLQLPVWDKKGSVGICFIGKRRMATFLANFLPPDAFAPGPIRCVVTGDELGRHQGLPIYTIGQSARLPGQSHSFFICGKEPNPVLSTSPDIPDELAPPAPITPVSPFSAFSSQPIVNFHHPDAQPTKKHNKDRKNRATTTSSSSSSSFSSSLNKLRAAPAPTLWVAPGHDHPAMHWRQASAHRVSFLSGSLPAALRPENGGQLFCHIQQRRTLKSVPALITIEPTPSSSSSSSSSSSPSSSPSLDQLRLRVTFAEPQFGVTPGQILGIYLYDQCLGAAVIDRAHQSCFNSPYFNLG